MTRRGPLAVGLVAIAAALVLTLHPTLLSGVPASLVVVLAVLAAGGIGVLGLLARATDGPSSESLVDGDATVRVPGDGIDERLDGVASDEAERERLRERIETAAVDVLVRRTGCSRDEARERLAAGEWTDDELARSLFDESATPGVGGRFRALVTGRTRFERATERAVEELLEREP